MIADAVQAPRLLRLGMSVYMAVEAHVATALRRLRDVGFEVVHLDAGLEGVIAPDLGDRVHALEAPDILHGGRVVADAECPEARRMFMMGKSSVAGHLRNALDAVLEGDIARTRTRIHGPEQAVPPKSLPQTDTCNLSLWTMPTCISLVSVGVRMRV
jgi:hypothetical protein